MAVYNKELQQKLIRDKLNADQVKLWLPPYTTENGEKGTEPQEIIEKYSKELNLPEKEVKVTIETLRQHALQKLAERNQFQQSGIATLKVKLPPSEDGKRHITSIQIKLNETGERLRTMVAELCHTSVERLKLITGGHIIVDNKTLTEQNVKNGAQLMGVLLSVTDVEAIKQEKEAENIQKTREAAEMLSHRAAKDDVDFDIQIADQNGRPLKLPKEEKQALTLAMTLHEKGRSFLKKQNISHALLLLLEADKEFRKCSAGILDAVDNYAVLCLDIVWSYLCLKNLDQLPDAERRLKSCEDCLIRSYGSNLERLTAVKGESGTEMALFMRLHLLQGIVAFHKHDIHKARTLLHQAEEDLRKLSVDPEQITEVMSMGFSEREARLGLRACDGNLQHAIDYIMKKKKEKEDIKAKVKEDREERKRMRAFGKTANGEWVNPHNLEMLMKMGYRRGPAGEALKQANNDVTLALDVLNSNPELLNLPDPEEDVPITDAMIAQLLVLGFEAEMCRRALVKNNGDISRAAEELVQSGGVMPPVAMRQHTSTSSSSASSSGATTSTSSESSDISPEEREVLNDLVSDIKQEGDEYLDLNLEDEKQFLNDYLSMLNSIS